MFCTCRILFWMERQTYQEFWFCHWLDELVDVTWSLFYDLLAPWYGVSPDWCSSHIELACKADGTYWHLLINYAIIMEIMYWCVLLTNTGSCSFIFEED
jgi:hypothetical protein